MAEALERNERARRSMVSDVAHELRTPLTSIRVQIEAVQDGLIAPDAKWIASIDEDAATLAHLAEDFQQLSLADAGALRLDLTRKVLSAAAFEQLIGENPAVGWAGGSAGTNGVVEIGGSYWGSRRIESLASCTRIASARRRDATGPAGETRAPR